jgi:threonine dehydrogenase-like Zn-dependent dehydrogenase
MNTCMVTLPSFSIFRATTCSELPRRSPQQTHLTPTGPFSCPPASRPHPLTKSHIPVTLGHEFVGRVVSAPSSSPELKEGTPVVVDPRLYCRECRKCKDGFTHGCDSLGFKGLSGGGGGFAETVCVDARQVYALPDDVDLERAALIEPLAVGWHAIKTTGVEDWRGRSVLVVGGGPVGAAVMIVLRAFGCKSIVVSEPTKVRASQNATVADVVLNPLEEDVGTRCRALTAGEGVNVVFDCAGNQKGFETGMDAVRYRGVYMNIAAWFGTPVRAPTTKTLP